MSFATNLQATALRLLSKYGQAVAVRRVPIATANINGTVTEGAEVEYAGYGHPSLYSNFLIAEGIVNQGDIRLLFYPTTAVTPQTNDIFDVGGREYTALNVTIHPAQGSNIYYTIQLRQ